MDADLAKARSMAKVSFFFFIFYLFQKDLSEAMPYLRHYRNTITRNAEPTKGPIHGANAAGRREATTTGAAA